jgi:two-component system sensor histidine kinase MtrB
MATYVLYDSRESLDPVEKRSAELLQREVERFSSMLDDLLEISRFDAGAAVLVLEEVDLAKIVHDEIAEFNDLSDEFNVEFELDSPEQVIAELDERRVRRIMRNLLGNAIDYAAGKKVLVKVAQDETSVAVSVRDFGVGFEPEQSELLFHRFWRADPSRQRLLGGTGLGLAIAREDTKLQHGWLEVWGRPNRGALFRLTLPLKAGTELHTSPLSLVPDGEDFD